MIEQNESKRKFLNATEKNLLTFVGHFVRTGLVRKSKFELRSTKDTIRDRIRIGVMGSGVRFTNIELRVRKTYDISHAS